MLACSTVANAQVSFQVLHSFDGSPDGALPYAALIQAADGNYYGTTLSVGGLGNGKVFRLSTNP